MTNVSLFNDSLRRLAAYVCLGAGVLSVSQMPIVTIAQVHAQEVASEQEEVPSEQEQEIASEQESAPEPETTDIPDDNDTVDAVVDTVDNDSQATTSDGVISEEPVTEEISAPVINVISGTDEKDGIPSGLPGSLVTVTGEGFSAVNTVIFGANDPIEGISSDDGVTLSFAVPNEVMTDMTYSIAVTNSADLTTAQDVKFYVADTQAQVVRARVVLTDLQNQNGGNTDDVVFLGSNTNQVAAGEWFNVYENGLYFNDQSTSGFEDVAGLAVRRIGDKVGLVLHGSHPTSGWREHVAGYIEFEGATVSCLEQDSANGNPLEIGFDKTMQILPGNDEVWVDGVPTNQAQFWLTVDTGDDGFYVQFDINNSGTQCNGINIIEEEMEVILTSLSPNQGLGGTVVTINGSGFTATANTIDFGGTFFNDVASTNGTTLTFTVPADVNNHIGDIYPVSVTNANGTSNELNFLATSTANNNTQLILTSLSPNQGLGGTVVTINGSGFTATANTIDFGGTFFNDVASTNGTTLTFTVPADVNNHIGDIYPVSVTNANGTSNELNFLAATGSNGNGTCSDGIQNGDETGVDVGGRCGNGGNGTCSDGIQNGDETGVDDGGRCGNDDDDDNGGGGGGRGGRGGRRRAPIASEPKLPNVCAPLITEFIKLGANNNPIEVTKLQTFLNEHEGEKLAVTGFYDLESFEAVKRFQTKYSSDVLNPWGDNLASTGYVFITTSLKINLLKCESDERINLDLRNYYPNPGAPGQEIGLLPGDVNDDNFAQATVTPATSTNIAIATTSDEEVSTSTSIFLLAAAGVLDFLGIYPWWWWLLVIALIIVISWLLKKSDDDDENEAGGNSEPVKVETGYLPLSQ